MDDIHNIIARLANGNEQSAEVLQNVEILLGVVANLEKMIADRDPNTCPIDGQALIKNCLSNLGTNRIDGSKVTALSKLCGDDTAKTAAVVLALGVGNVSMIDFCEGLTLFKQGKKDHKLDVDGLIGEGQWLQQKFVDPTNTAPMKPETPSKRSRKGITNKKVL